MRNIVTGLTLLFQSPVSLTTGNLTLTNSSSTAMAYTLSSPGRGGTEHGVHLFRVQVNSHHIPGLIAGLSAFHR